MNVLRWLRRRHAVKQMVETEATALASREGKQGYFTARKIARLARGNGDRDAWRLWSKIASRVADKTGYVIGWSKLGQDD